jgi:hypothetical protein
VIIFEQLLPEVTSPRLFTVAPLHASDAVGATKLGVAVQLMVALAPGVPIVGGTLSMMVNV